MASLGRVVVVEDEPQVALLLHDVLQDFGYEVRVAVNGHEALPLVADYQPAVVLLDLWLPGLPGESILEALPDACFVLDSPTRDVVVVETEKMRGDWMSRAQLAAAREAMETWSQIVYDEVLA